MSIGRGFVRERLSLTVAFGALVAVAMGAGCAGFFPNPTLESLAVGPPNETIQTGTTGNTLQFSAVGTYDTETRPDSAVTWGSSNKGVATISSGGLATAVAQGQTTITATSTEVPTIQGTTTLTVTVGCITSIAVTPKMQTINSGQTQQYDAMASTCNGTVDITDTASWASSNTSVATVDATGLASPQAVTVQSTTNITATAGGIVSNTAVLTVTP